MKALIVDDNSEFRALLRYQFETHGWEAVEAADGQEGLEKGAKHKPDLIVSDALMPRMDGFQFLKKAKKDTELKSVPFVFYSSVYTGKKEEELALSLGAAKFIVKPKEPEEFWREIAPVIEKGAPTKEIVTELLEEEEEFIGRYCNVVAAKLEEKVRELEKEIFERTQMEGELLASRDLLGSVVENVPIRIFWKDRESRYLGCNTLFAQDAGLSRPEELLGKDDFQMGWREQAELYRTDDKKVMDSDTPKLAFEEPSTSPDGRAILLRTSKVPLHDAKGKVFGVLGIYEDITERKRTEETIKRMNEELEQKVTHLAILNQLDRAILSSLDVQDVFKSLGGELDRLIQFDSLQVGIIEDAEIHFFPHKIKGREATDYKSPIQGSALEQLRTNPSPILRKDLNAEIVFQEDGYLLNAGMQSCLFLPLISKGIVIGLFCLASKAREAFFKEDLELLRPIADQLAIAVENATLYHDLEKKVAQRTAELVVKNKELAELARARAEFLSTASHDLRAPLTGVLGFAELLLMEKAGPLNDTVKRYIGTIHKSGKDLLAIIEDFLEISRIDAGRIKINRQEFNIAEGVSHAVASMESLFSAKNLRLVTALEENLPTVDADPNRFNQMLTNYLSNALKFTYQGSVTIRAKKEGAMVRLSVEDTGIGIKQEDLSKLFQRFSQLEETRYTFKGTGLGLAIVKQLAEMQGGAVGVESEAGKGSTFWFTLPVYKKR